MHVINPTYIFEDSICKAAYIKLGIQRWTKYDGMRVKFMKENIKIIRQIEHVRWWKNNKKQGEMLGNDKGVEC